MFIIKVVGYNKMCYVGKDHRPCKDINDARLFKTRQIAGGYIVKNWTNWNMIKDGSCTMTVQEL